MRGSGCALTPSALSKRCSRPTRLAKSKRRGPWSRWSTLPAGWRRRARDAGAQASLPLDRKARATLGLPDSIRSAEIALGADRGQEIAARLLASVNLADLDPARRALFGWLQDVYGPSWSGSEQVRSFVHAADEAISAGDSLLALRLFSQVALRLWWTNLDRQTRELVVGALDRLDVERDDPHLIMSLALAAPVERGAILLEPFSTEWTAAR